ncbi:NAD(P)-binding domain-containing protein [Pedobacter sp. Leaf194]|uniref:NAD(P)-binding domain-containing protein n=1 Tax=Pedobacter sp. Leaf194 TaxID=1736297 RepID=UPI0007033F36|nr:NAD(P)-binding domain-containing protein [Pedobacter sp. Leaf194]KQS35972.1 hypothetical protein ASG14_11020 [Pedobacter sp. Leaf194]
MKKNISILGCGWFGFALAKKLIENGYNVKGSTTTPEKILLLAEAKVKPFLINFTGEKIVGNDDFFDADVLFICIPPKRNSAELESYPFKIKSILESAENRSANIVLISSTSVYGDENKTVNENTSTRPDTASGGVVADAEEVFKIKYPQNYTIIRFAGLIGPERNPGRFFAGKTNVPNGLAPVNLIHQTDAVGIAISILDKQAFGRIYNACAPTHPSKQEFYTKAALDSGLQSPEFVAEKASWKIVESINVPEFLGYAFEIKL